MSIEMKALTTRGIAISLGTLASLVMVGCQPKTQTAAEVQATAQDQAALERIMAIPLCEDISRSENPEADPMNMFGAADCRLNPAGGENPSNVQILVDFADVDPANLDATGVVRVEVAELSGKSLQVFEEKDLYEYVYPSVKDVDGDGKVDLLVARETGNVNTVHALWLQRGEWAFTRAGEVSGVDVMVRPDGLIASVGRSTAASYYAEFYRIENDLLRLYARAETLAEDVDLVGEDAQVKSTVCTAWPPEDGSMAPEALCAQPEVKEAFGDVPFRVIIADDAPGGAAEAPNP